MINPLSGEFWGDPRRRHCRKKLQFDDIGCSPYDEHIYLKRKAPEKYGAIVCGKLHTPDIPSDVYRPHGGPGFDK